MKRFLRKASDHWPARRGQAVALVTLSLIPTLGIMGLVVDIGYAY